MVAIVTDDFKKKLVQELITDLNDSGTNYYIGIAKSDQWNATDAAPAPINSEREERQFRTNLQSVIKTTDVSHVIPRYNWSSGTIYQAYSDEKTATGTNANGQYYVQTSSNRVYICLQQGKSATGTPVPSSVDPDTTLTTTSAVATADGYIWKYLYTHSAISLSKFGSANFIPVQLIDSGTLTNIQQAQQDVQNAAVPGEIIGYKIIDGGASYNSGATLTVNGNGSSARAIATVSGGVIVKAEVDDSAGGIPFGAGYDYANVVVTGVDSGSGAIIRPVIAKNGIGADPRDDLRTRAVMFNAKIVGEAGDGDFLVDQDFRQVGLIRNPKVPNSRSTVDSDFTATTGTALRILTLDDSNSGIAADQTIVGQTSGARAFVDKVSSSNNRIVCYHQNENTGFIQFTASDTSIQDSSNASNEAGFVSDSDGEVDPFSGQVLYIENRSPVTRTTLGTEDIKVIVQF